MKILEMSASAAVLIILIVIVRAFAVHKLPKWSFLILWGLVLCRLLLPFSIQSPFSAYNAINHIPQLSEDTQHITTVIMHTAERVAVTIPDSKNTLSASNALPAFSSLLLIWLAGIVLMAAYFLVTHLRWLREYKSALPNEDDYSNQWLAKLSTSRKIRLRQSDQITSPLTYGILRPVILLPKTMDYTDTRQLQFMLTHELIHIKRFDTLKKWLLAASLCIHWFNPFVWLMYILANRDIELSCDESVVRTFGEAKKSSYALALIGMEETKSRLLTPLSSNFSKNAIEERITAIMKLKKMTIGSLLLVLALLAGTTAVFATSAVETQAASLLEKALGEKGYPYANNINKASGETARVTTQDYALYLDSTIFTDNHVYAMIRAKGSLPESLNISGRIVYAAHDQTIYALKGESKEIEPDKDGTRYFLYSAIIGESGDAENTDPKVLLAAGDQFLKFNSLRDHAGELLEITINLNGNEHILTTAVANVSTKTLIFHPDAARYTDDFFETILLTPYELKMDGRSNQEYKSPEEMSRQLYTRIAIVLVDGTTINMSYDSRGIISDEGYPLGMSLSQVTRKDGFHHYANWNFRQWELDLSRVTSLIVDGATYYAAK